VKQSHFSAAFSALSIGLCVWNPAASGQTQARAKTVAPHAGLTCEDVIKLARAGLAEDIIIQQIKKNGHAFDLSTDQLVALKAANVSDRIVEVMLDPSRTAGAAEPPPPPVSKPTGLPSSPPAPPPPPEARTTPIEAERHTVHAALPTEAGVYVKNHGQWVEVPPEIVYWKTGGVLKTVATAGIRHGDVNGHIPGTESRTRLEGPLEFLIVAPEGVALAEYQLLRLRRNHDNREFRTVTGGFLHSQSGAQRDVVQFDGKKLAARAYQVSFPESAGPGEYGFLPPGSNNGSGKVYSFEAVQ